MKFSKITMVLVFVCSFIFVDDASAQLKITDDFVHLFHDQYGNVTFGESTASPNRGQFALEYWSEKGGLNLWRPWPLTYNGNYRLFIKDNGYIGIGRIPSYKLDVAGDIAVYGTVKISSDFRFKKDIKNISGSLGRLKNLQGVSYVKLPEEEVRKKEKPASHTIESLGEVKYNTMYAPKPKKDGKTKETTEIGFIAQDLREVFPELVSEDKDGYLSIDYISLIPVLVEALKEQQAEIDELKQAILKATKN
ncbi:tail fiber domain-containing protein [Puteibacter caeruleilacunae]|nr:tail fiber domain-containing protein [Puteibacter caeruleilacunae]